MRTIKYFALSILLLSALGQLLAQTCLHDQPLKHLKTSRDSWCLEANGYYVHSIKFSPLGETRINYAIDIAENETEREDLIPFRKNPDVSRSMTVFFALILIYFVHYFTRQLSFHRNFSFFKSCPRYLIFQVIRI